MTRLGFALVGTALFAVLAAAVVPMGLEAGSMLAGEDDPVAIADRALSHAFDQAVAAGEIEAALTANDADLAKSFVELAQARGVTVPPALADRVAAAVERAQSAAGHAKSFARGLIMGEPDNVAALAGTALGDLFVFGDIRDAVRQGVHYANGRPVDELVLGLSAAGIAITAGTYASFGITTPVRVGLSVIKAARKAGRISAGMTAAAVQAGRRAVKVGKADNIVRLAGDVGRVQARAGTRAAFDALKLAQNPRDLARIAKLAEKQGGKTRAILKTLGRGAILLSVASWNLVAWMLGAIFTLLGLVCSAKSMTERATQRWLDRRKRRRHARLAAATASPA